MGSKTTQTTQTSQQISTAEGNEQKQLELEGLQSQLAGATKSLEKAALKNKIKDLQSSMSGAIKVSDLEKLGKDVQQQGLSDLQKFVNAGPGEQDITSALGSQRGLAAMLGQYAAGGNQPTAQDIAQAGQFTNQIFAPQQEQQRQMFEDQATQARRLSAQMNRPVNDPVLQAKLAQEQARQQAMLGAQQTAFSADYAMQQPGQRLNFAGQQTSVLQGLADQAMKNRSAITSLGSGIREAERSFRLQAGRNQGSNTTTTQTGANAFDVIGGGLSLLGAASGIPGVGSMFGGSGGGGGSGGQASPFSLGVNMNVGGGGGQPSLPGTPVSSFGGGAQGANIFQAPASNSRFTGMTQQGSLSNGRYGLGF